LKEASVSKEPNPALSQGETSLLHLLEHHGPAIEAATARALSQSRQVWARPHIREWLLAVSAGLRGKADPSLAWSARLAEDLLERGESLFTGLDLLMHLREGLLTVGASRAKGLSGEWLYEEVLRITDSQFRQMLEHCAQAERELQGAERRRRHMMMEASADPYALLDNSGRLVAWNTAMGRVLGQGSERLAKSDFGGYCGAGADEELRKVLRQRRSTAPRAFSGGLIAGDGHMRPAAFKVQPIFDAKGLREGLAVTVDFVEDHNGEDGSAFMAQTLGEMLRFVPVAMQVMGVHGAVDFHSGTCGGLLTEDELAAKPLCCRLLPKAPETDQCRCREVFAGAEAQEAEASLSRAEKVSWLRFIIVPLRDRLGQVTHVSCVAMDVSQRRGLEHQILEQQRTSAVAQVAQAVAHELRNPLGVMIGFSEMLAKGLPPDKIYGAVEKILNNGLRCKEIVEDLLEFGQSLPGDRIVTPLRALVADHVQPMYTGPQKRRIHWDLPPASVRVECVPHQLAQVFVSLLDNALIFGQRVELTATAEDGCVVIRVIDDGPGVPETFHGRLFEPFFTTRKESGGVGLGLSLSRSVVTEYGGRLYLEEDRPHGACFVIELPLAAQEASPSAPAQASAPSMTEKAHRILIVDDEVDLVEMLETALGMRGYTVDTAATAAAAVDLLMERDYAAAVLDVQLPGELSGRQLYEYIQANRPGLAGHTLFITADTMNFETRQFLDQIQRPHMEKPFLVADFTDRIAGILK